MVDPDAPSRKDPKFRSWRHWLVVNIPGNDVRSGEVKTKYMGSAPPHGSGLHRYIFLLFKQESNIKVLDFEEGARGSFTVRDFVSYHKLGIPVAGNFFVAQNK